MHRILGLARSLLDFYYRLTAYISGAIIIIITLTIVTEIILRSGFGISIPFMLQLCSLFFFIMTFLAAPWVMRYAGHIRMDFVVERLTRRKKVILNLFVFLLALVLCVFLAYICTQYMTSVWARGTRLAYPLWIPMAPFLLVVVAAWSLLALEYFILFWKELRALITKPSVAAINATEQGKDSSSG